MESRNHHITFDNQLAQISYGNIYGQSGGDTSAVKGIDLLDVTINQAVFEVRDDLGSYQTTVIQDIATTVTCNCGYEHKRLCAHESSVLFALIKNESLLTFFNDDLRLQKLKRFAFDYGLENSSELEQHFTIGYENGELKINPINKSLTPVTQEHLQSLNKAVTPNTTNFIPQEEKPFIVFSKHKYYNLIQINLCQSEWTKQGKPKNPIQIIDTQQRIWETNEVSAIKFLMGITRFQNHTSDHLNSLDIQALRTIIRNPNHYNFYNNSSKADQLSASNFSPIEVKILPNDIVLKVARFKETYEIKAELTLHNTTHSIFDLPLHYKSFLEIGKTWYFIDQLPVINAVNLLNRQHGQMIISSSAFEEFKKQFLDKIEAYIRIEYTFIEKASPTQLAMSDYLEDVEKLIYLTDHGSHVMIIPVMRYSDVEISVRTNRQIYGRDEKGHEFLVDRNIDNESDLLALLVKQHPDFNEQLENPLDHFYLHKRKFLDETWFLPVFEEWETQGIRVYGFNELEGHKFNPHKPKIDIKVHSGLNWFNAEIKMKFGKKKAGLKKVQVAVKNKSKYVQLDDGSLGILPKEWLERFEAFFTAGDLTEDDLISIPKIHISDVEAMFQQEELDEQVIEEIRTFQNKVRNFTEISDVKQPVALKGTLRPYQLDGLKWLNFLDDFNFGGCLADDMGLGKSIQIIAFMLLQNEKVERNTNLLVVPTTLIFNWQAELKKFAPSLSVHTLHGPDRMRVIKGLENFEVIITTYGTLLTDINYMKNFTFNYVFLDESQQIKNPNSQRFKAVKMLQARNRIAVTGTPIENNTFDLYSQFSFACPGLFSTKQHFKELYSVPIDQFKDQRRAKDLQNKIKPFLLRRTKDEVAKELPLKLETVLYCPMEKEQSDTYAAFEKEFREFVSATEAEQLKDATMHVLRGLTKLRQICNSTKLLKSDEVVGHKTSSKIEVLKEQIELNAPHHKMVIFSQFVSMLELIQAELASMNVNHIMLTGKSSNREAIVNEFRNNDDVRVALISLKAGGTGLNLVEADYVYLVDPWWNPAVENQAIDRLHRIGQEKNITAIRLICPGTLEEKIMQLQESKKELTSQMVGNNDSFFEGLTRKELLGLVSVY
ncbi:MAG: DNA helicase [Flammeovirgaceae bacterium]|nr:DNA helicase [Flammeovirgaceae bacterium]